MTDRQPDDLYDALRDRLADYGQEPPAPLWATIRAQLPPPVAAPQLRRRRRTAWLGTLLVLLSAATLGWWWRAGHGPLRPGAGLANQTTPTAPARQAAPLGAATGTVAGARVTPPRPAAVGPATAATGAAGGPAGLLAGNQPTASTVGTAMVSPTDSLAVSLGTTPALALANARTRSAVARRAGTGLLLAAGRAGSSHGTRPAKNRAPAERTSRKGRNAAAYSQTSAVAGAAMGLTSRAATTAWGSRPETGAVGSQAAPGAIAGKAPAREASVTSALAAALTTTTPDKTVGKAPQLAGTNEPNRSGQQTTPTAPTTPNSTNGTAQPAATLADATGVLPGGAATPARSDWQPVGPRATALKLLPTAVPGVLARADTLPRLPLAMGRRWAVQALAGPALTSRTLSFAQLSYAPAPANTYPFPAGSPTRGVQSTGSPENEQAAYGFGAEVLAQRQLNGRWSLGTGLGYQAFATNQTVQVRVTYRSTPATYALPDSLGTLSVRGTYHFLTLPLRVGYQLGAGRGHLRYGLRAGADVALYLGGRSTEGSSTGSTSRTWGIGGSPYRPLSLALSLGAEVRYQFAPGWELLAQPTLTHFATSVARPASGYVPRYPLAATALVGVAYWLR